MNRTSIALAVLAGTGIAGAAGFGPLDPIVSPAAAQQAGQEQVQQERERRQRQGEEQIARAAGEQPGMPTMSIRTERSEEHGEYLTDGDGRALYLLDTEQDGESTCYDRCAEQWPPALAVQGQTPETERGVDESLLGTFERRDGSTQITYGDYPVYYYQGDQGPGETTGHDIHGQMGGWYLISPEGEPIEQSQGQAQGQDQGAY